MDNLKSRIYQLNKKIKRLEKAKTDFKSLFDIEYGKYTKHIRDLNLEVTLLENENQELSNPLEVLKTYENGQYTSDARECCMELLTEGGVSQNKIPFVINSVVTKLTGSVANKLPSQSLLSKRILPEAKYVACRQVGTALLKDFDPTSDIGNVLHQDATTKFSQHYEGMQATLKDGSNLSLGLCNVGGGDANTYVNAFQNIIDDIVLSFSSDSVNDSEYKAKLITSFKSFLSDQCATNPVFNNAISKIREDLLPKVIPNFCNLSKIDQERISDMGQFACRLHLLANFGIAADKALRLFEDTVTEGKNPFAFKSNDSGTFRLARNAATALTKRGSDKNGIASYWNVFLQSRGTENALLTFHGHRINIAFYNCAAVFFHKQDICDILKDWKDPNGLLQALFFDVKEKVFLAGARAMGIFYELVTTPFWLLLEKAGSILEINDELHQMKLTLTTWANDGTEPLNGTPLFPLHVISYKSSKFHDVLFNDSNDAQLDSLTVIALELLSAQLLIILERQAATQLPGGKYFSPSANLLETSSNVPTTNAISERDMAILDNLLRIKPSSSTMSLETILMWTRNKPSVWLETMSENEKDSILKQAMKFGPTYVTNFRERQKTIQKQIEERLAEKKSQKLKL
ncbi:hypothetical protein SNE40_019911 [Patella caerulea]